MEATSPARDGTVVASQLTYQPNSDRMFLKPLSPTFNFEVTVVLSSDERLSFSADDIFTSIICKRRTLRTARRLMQRNVFCL